FGHKTSHDQFSRPCCLYGSPYIGMRPCMSRRAIDRSYIRKQVANFFEDGVGENTSLSTDCSQYNRHAEISRRLCQTSNIVNEEAWIDRLHTKGDPGLMINKHHH